VVGSLQCLSETKGCLLDVALRETEAAGSRSR
jgi:hypothetical protein